MSLASKKDVDNMQNWAKTWQMSFNYDKCKVIHFDWTLIQGRDAYFFQYSLAFLKYFYYKSLFSTKWLALLSAQNYRTDTLISKLTLMLTFNFSGTNNKIFK